MDPVTTRDLEQLKTQRELMRKATLEGPTAMLPGETHPLVRRFAQETFMNMRMLDPAAFKDKTIDNWETAIKAYISTRRPEFRTQLLENLKKKYSGGEGDPETPRIIIMGARERVKKAEYRGERVHLSTIEKAIKKIQNRKEKGEIPPPVPPVGPLRPKKLLTLGVRKVIERVKEKAKS